MNTRIEEAFAQGVRCGHIDGQSRVGVYVLSEEYLTVDDVESGGNTEFTATDEREAWRDGYCRGYRIGADGELLPLEYQYPVERKPASWQ